MVYTSSCISNKMCAYNKHMHTHEYMHMHVQCIYTYMYMHVFSLHMYSCTYGQTCTGPTEKHAQHATHTTHHVYKQQAHMYNHVHVCNICKPSCTLCYTTSGHVLYIHVDVQYRSNVTRNTRSLATLESRVSLFRVYNVLATRPLASTRSQCNCSIEGKCYFAYRYFILHFMQPDVALLEVYDVVYLTYL